MKLDITRASRFIGNRWDETRTLYLKAGFVEYVIEELMKVSESRTSIYTAEGFKGMRATAPILRDLFCAYAIEVGKPFVRSQESSGEVQPDKDGRAKQMFDIMMSLVPLIGICASVADFRASTYTKARQAIENERMKQDEEREQDSLPVESAT
jgi:hypothetical protein